MSTVAITPPADWYPDPSGRHHLRYWSGGAWSGYVSDAGAVGEDPEPAPGVIGEPSPQWSPSPYGATFAPIPVAPATPQTTRPLRECRAVGPAVPVARRVANVASALLIGLGTLEVVFWAVFNSSASSVGGPDVPFDGAVFWGTRGNLDVDPGAFWVYGVYVMGPVFLAALIVRLVVAAVSPVKHTVSGYRLAQHGVSPPTYYFKAQATVVWLGVGATLSLGMVAFYLWLTSSISDQGYDIRAFGWVGLALMVTMAVGDLTALVVPRGERLLVDRSGNLYPEAQTPAQPSAPAPIPASSAVLPPTPATPSDPEMEPTPISGTTKTCLACGEDIEAEALLCNYCGQGFRVRLVGYCTTCHHKVDIGADHRCPTCGVEVLDVVVENTPAPPQPTAR